MIPPTQRKIHYEEVPEDLGSAFTFREFSWPSFPFNWHYHPEVELTLIVQGRGLRFVGDSVEEFSDGDLCLLGKNLPHCWASHKNAEPGVKSLVVQFRPELWGEAFWKLPELRGVARLLEEARRGLELKGAGRREVEQLFHVLEQQRRGSLQRFDTLLEMLHCIAQSRDKRLLATAGTGTTAGTAVNGTTGKLGKILGYIHAHLGPELTQHEVAAEVHLSPAAFSQFFRRSLGTSYVSYVNELKIRNACRLLLETDETITEIAFNSGFNNLSHFNAQFQRFRKVSPREFRLQARATDRVETAPSAPVAAVGDSGGRTVPVMPTQDVTVHSDETHFDGVRVGTEEPRPWLKRYAVCPALQQLNVVHTGYVEAHTPYKIVRTKQTTSYFLACFGGRGQVLVDGRWRTIRPGLACLLPPHVFNAFEALPGEPWRFMYVCFDRGEVAPKAASSAPVVAEFEPEPLRLAILGLTAECRSRSRETQVAHWLGLIKGYLQDFTQPFPKDSPLQTLWLRVAARLDHEWTPETLAREAGCSPERLRRMCHRELGRSPLQQVVYLRMRKAAELLGPNQLTLREVAKAVGYENPLRFSNAFKAHVGCRPSEYRQRNVEKNA